MRNGKRVENILHFRELMQTVSWKCGEHNELYYVCIFICGDVQLHVFYSEGF